MPENEGTTREDRQTASGRRGFLYTALGGAVAALTGWIAGAFPRDSLAPQEDSAPSAADNRISTLEAQVAHLAEEPPESAAPPIAELEGEANERVVFRKSELTVTNPDGVLLNLVATQGHVGIRFYKDFDFGNEQVTNPWHMGFIEGVEGYQGLAILRDWRFTAALWGEDGKLLLGSLDPHPPANEPARARVHVRGTLDEVQTIVEGSAGQAADVFQVVGGQGTARLAVDGAGRVAIGVQDEPGEVILHDTAGGSAHSLKVTNGQLTLTRA